MDFLQQKQQIDNIKMQQKLLNHLNQSIKKYFIKGSGTSHCLLNNSTNDQAQFIKFRFRQYLSKEDQSFNVKQISMAGLYLIILLQNGQVYRLGSFNNHQVIFKIPTPMFLNSISTNNLLSTKIKIKQISSGWDHTIMQSQQEQFYGLGSNKYLELGLEEKVKYVIDPQKINHLTQLAKNQQKKQHYKQQKSSIIGQKAYNITKFICGFRQSYFIFNDHQVYGCGESKKYQLGIKSSKCRQLSFIQNLQTQFEVKKLSTSKRAIFLLDSNDDLYVMGSNQHNMCFDSLKQKIEKTNKNQSNKQQQRCSSEFFSVFTKINCNVLDVQCGWNYLLILKKGQKQKKWLQSYGRNNFGQLGRQTPKAQTKNDKGQQQHHINSKQEQQQSNTIPIASNSICLQIPADSKVSIKAGTQFSFCSINQKVYGWGWNQHQNIVNTKQQFVSAPRQLKEDLKRIHSLISDKQIQQTRDKFYRVWTYPAITILQMTLT